MSIQVREKNRKAGVHYAMDEDGVELPIIDVTHPAFALSPSEAELDELTAGFMRDEERRKKVPLFLQRLIVRLVFRRSILGRGLLAAGGTFLDGMSTYRMKLGPDNLGSHAGDIDRKIAAGLPCFAMRLRLQDMARLLADGLAPRLDDAGERPLHLVNIGGGPAPDSLNALMVLRKERPASLAGRRIVLHLLDLEAAGPLFAERALAALRAEGAPLHGLDVELRRIRYDWSRPSALRATLSGLVEDPPLVAVSSEGALFEYGSDEAIVDNLAALREATPGETILVGSVTRGDGPAHHVNTFTRVSTRPRGLAVFRELAERGGWTVIQHLDRPFCHDVRMEKSS